jgi:hypothetical protein
MDHSPPHQAYGKDLQNNLLTSAPPPIDHALLLREEIYFNAAVEPVKIRQVFKKSAEDPTEIAYIKRVVPQSGDEAIVGSPMTFYAWAAE